MNSSSVRMWSPVPLRYTIYGNLMLTCENKVNRAIVLEVNNQMHMLIRLDVNKLAIIKLNWVFIAESTINVYRATNIPDSNAPMCRCGFADLCK